MKIYQNSNNGKNPVFQTKAADSTSSKYGFISSENIVSYFQNQGFELDGISYAKTRNPEKQGFQKHIMVFSMPDLLIDGGNKLQILALNSHDASQSLRLNVGVYRAVCANGLISGEDIFEERITHIGNFRLKLEEALKKIVHNLPLVKEQIVAMQNKEVSFSDAKSFMRKMVDLRLQGIEGLREVNLATVDQVRRGHDASNDLYTFYNRVQESIIRGGIQYTKEVAQFNEDKSPILGPNGETVFKLKSNTTREVKDFKRNIELNKALWNEALKLAA